MRRPLNTGFEGDEPASRRAKATDPKLKEGKGTEKSLYYFQNYLKFYGLVWFLMKGGFFM